MLTVGQLLSALIDELEDNGPGMPVMVATDEGDTLAGKVEIDDDAVVIVPLKYMPKDA